MLITEANKWSQIITEEYGVTDRTRLDWMSKYAQIHAIHEAQQNPNLSMDGGVFTTPLNTLGIGNPQMPEPAAGFAQTTGIGNTGADFHNPLYNNGSGDIPMSTLPMALEIAAITIGFELVPVIPSTGPWTMLTYFDTPYAGGKLGKLNETWADGIGKENENKPIYIKFNYGTITGDKKTIVKESVVTVTGTKTITPASGDDPAVTLPYTLTGKFLGFSRIDNNMLIEVVSAQSGTGNTAEDCSIADVFGAATSVSITGSSVTFADMEAGTMRATLVTGAADHVQEFGNFAKRNGKNNLDPMTRAENETGLGNTLGARMFSKMVQMGSYEVTGSVTRQQLQDMPLYGIDVIGKVLEAMQNEISQDINNRILDRVFKLGVTNAKIQKDYQGVDLNLNLGNTEAALSTMVPVGKYVDIMGYDWAYGIDADGNTGGATWGNVKPSTAAGSSTVDNGSAFMYAQRRIMSRLLAAANLIASVSRRGRGQWAVMSAKTLSALQDNAAFVIAPMTNTLTQNGQNSLYFAGSLAGLNLYVDPYMTWDDGRICVGRKSNGSEPGVIFMPYILADTVQTVAEATMAPKLLVNSRFAIVDAGFYPEQSYYTFVVNEQAGYEII